MDVFKIVLVCLAIGCIQAQETKPCENLDTKLLKCYTDNNVVPLVNSTSNNFDSVLPQICDSKLAYEKAMRCDRQTTLNCLESLPDLENPAELIPSPDRACGVVHATCDDKDLLESFNSTCVAAQMSVDNLGECLFASPTDQNSTDLERACTNAQTIADCVSSLTEVCGSPTQKLCAKVATAMIPEACPDIKVDPIHCSSSIMQPTALLLSLVLTVGVFIGKLKDKLI